MKSEALIASLEEQIARLRKLAGEEVGGFFLIHAPDSEPIATLVMESGPNKEAFYVYLKNKIIEAQKAEEQNNPLIGMRGGLR